MTTEFVRLAGGAFRMGSDRFYLEEQPVHEATVGTFEIARFAVTNREFARFAAATGYRTVAERPLDPNDFPGADSHEPGSLVFVPSSGPVDLRDWRIWWRWMPGASWRHPWGPDSDLVGLEDHPVVHIAREDAVAYAEFCGARLPTEAEWEFAARGGLSAATFAWGEQPNDGSRANTWQGRFPYRNDGANGWFRTAPVGSFPPNGFGLHEMTGNTWEWTDTPWTSQHTVSCHCGAGGPRSRDPERSPRATAALGPASAPEERFVTKGGSFLCSPEYCFRFRPAARSPQSPDSSTVHLGFRLARDAVDE